MSRESSPAFQFYPSDFLTDEKVMAMSLAQRGAYITLLCVCWREGSIPADLRKLRQLLKVRGIVATRIIKICTRAFTKFDDAGVIRYIHPRLERERQKQEKFRKTMKEAGRLGGLASVQQRLKSKPGSSQAQARLKPRG